jgi:hypothetical protein
LFAAEIGDGAGHISGEPGDMERGLRMAYPSIG